ncbi:HTH-type transcriptional repressor FabR [Hahella sp. SMD15-11]|uniref:HTH-type transcriptional repressor FabR n=1 Tax=Thermohahella caldifontis TaxID=3142973 RepID=A0AB39UWL9_9GAMM
MAGRNEQKQRTRRALLDAALRQLDAEKSFSSLSLREVAREAGIAPTSFYRHFSDMEELGLALVDEGGVTLRQLMRQARKRIASSGSAIQTSLDTFLEYLSANASLFRLLLRERSGLSRQFRAAIKAEIDHFVTELSWDLERKANELNQPLEDPRLVAEAMVTLVFNAGADLLDSTPAERQAVRERLARQLRYVLRGAQQEGRRRAVTPDAPESD